MMIRAYRMRGHPEGQPPPAGFGSPLPAIASELDLATYGFSEADYDRPIFLDFVLGLETATIREILEIVRRTYCGNVGVQYMHISDPKGEGWLQARIEGRDKEIVFTKEGKVAIPAASSRPRASRSSCTAASPAPSASAWTAARAWSRRFRADSSSAVARWG